MEAGTIAPSNIVINGAEYTPEEAQELIDLGSRTRENETKWNTKVDNVWPEYGKTREQLKTVQQERDEAIRQVEEFKAKQDQGTDTPVDREKARKAAKELGFVLDEDIKGKYLSKEEIDKYLDERDQKRETAKQVEAEGKKLEGEIDGKDGRPRFVYKHVLAYAHTFGHNDLKAAYEDMYKDQLDAWKAARVEDQKRKPLHTFGSSGAKKEPEKVAITDDNVKDALHEKLWGAS